MNSTAQLANGLYPIIRRVRRPLIAPDAAPLPAPSVETKPMAADETVRREKDRSQNASGETKQ